MSDGETHADRVDAWLKAANRGPTELLEAFERALNALWGRTVLSLGEITLTAILERVLYTASERYPVLALLELGSDGIDLTKLRAKEIRADDQLDEAVRFVLIEFLTVLGNLTAEILTPALHAELLALAAAAQPETSERNDSDDEKAQ